MLRKLLGKIASWFRPKSNPSKSWVKLGDKDGNVTILSQYQLDKRTHFKPGDSYRVGEAVATVHATKESMLKAVAVVEARRIAKELAKREKAIEIMLMSPDELKRFNLEEWLARRGNSKEATKIRSVMNMSPRETLKKLWSEASKKGYQIPEGHFYDIEKLKDEELLVRFKELAQGALDCMDLNPTTTVEKSKLVH